MDLFDFMEVKKQRAPLADRMRPERLEDFCGQSEIVGMGKALYRAIENDCVPSCIFYGPPGSGKTTLANIIAKKTSGNFVKLNAVSAGVSDVKEVIKNAEDSLKMYAKKTYLLLDECHRFNKAQSDSLLPAVEKGTVIFIGSTTENPYSSMTGAIVSRCRVFKFERLLDNEIIDKLREALSDKTRGLGNYDVEMEDGVLNHIAFISGGDLRSAYNALELMVLTTPPDNSGKIKIGMKEAEESTQRKALSYDRTLYYDVLSAFCKSLRGSDSNAALYYAQRLLKGGCDPMLIMRRVIAHSCEDVGLADPNALQVAVAACGALERIGMPEAILPISEAIIYVCEAPKSNSVVIASDSAGKDAENMREDNVPAYLRDVSFASEEDRRKAADYKYPHNYGGYCEQQYLPDSLKDRKYYIPSEEGFEREIRKLREYKEKMKSKNS